jgi:hypothetical protein
MEPLVCRHSSVDPTSPPVAVGNEHIHIRSPVMSMRIKILDVIQQAKVRATSMRLSTRGLGTRMDNGMDSTISKADADRKRSLLECLLNRQYRFATSNFVILLPVESLEGVIHGLRPFD